MATATNRYLIFFLSCFLVIFGFPGESVGISAITNSILSTTGMGRNTFSVIYTFATITGSCLVLYTSPLIDRLGIRKSTLCALFLCAVLFLTFGNGEFLYSSVFCNILPHRVYLVIFFYVNLSLLRFVGQNMLPMLGRIQLVKVFSGKQGMAIAMGGVFVAIFSGLSPRIMHFLSDGNGWQNAYVTLSAVALIAFAVFFVLFVDVGQTTGVGPGKQRVGLKKAWEDISKKKLLKMPIFWCIMLPVCINSFIGSGSMVHIADIFEENGRSADIARDSCFYYCCISPLAGIFFGKLVDSNKIKHGILTMLGMQFFALIGLELSKNIFGIFMYALCIGCTWGGYGVLKTAAWSKIFGEKNIGSILGLIYFCSAVVGAVSVSMMSFSREFFGSYFHLMHAIGVVILVIMAFVIKYFPRMAHENYS